MSMDGWEGEAAPNVIGLVCIVTDCGEPAEEMKAVRLGGIRLRLPLCEPCLSAVREAIR